MKNLISVLCAVMLVMGLACYANAASYEVEWTGSVWLNSSNDSQTWSFDLDADTLDVGNISAGDTINSATLEIVFYDDDDEGAGNPRYFSQTAEFADLTIDGTLALNDEEIETGAKSFDVLNLVSGDHSLEVLLTWLDKIPSGEPWAGYSAAGDFEVQSVKLSGDYSAAAVPIPGAMWLLGSGLLGLIGIRRKRNYE